MKLLGFWVCKSLIGTATVALMLGSLTAFAAPVTGARETTGFFACGGELEANVWRLWDGNIRAFVQQQLIEKRLVQGGDSYALYDVQTQLHNLLAMAQRCNRIDRQLQFVKIVNSAYSTLEHISMTSLWGQTSESTGRGWICRGGRNCNAVNRLIDKEVMLNSVQFLAFASSLANGLPHEGAQEQKSITGFVEETAQIVAEHLTRWGAPEMHAVLRRKIAATPDDVKDGSSLLFFTDHSLWQIALYADWAGILAKQPQLVKELKLVTAEATFEALRDHLSLLLRFWAARATVQTVPTQDGQSQTVAVLDSGFWRLHKNNRYAGYTSAKKPVICARDPKKPGRLIIKTQVDANSVRPIGNIGWDFSHARRLVHFFNSIERNRPAIARIFGVPAQNLPSRDMMTAFAHQLRIGIWNQDRLNPLFSNYFSGANGWYRVAYDNGTGRCMEGYPPFGLTHAFPTGGYATWAALDHDLKPLGERIYSLSQSSAVADKAFIQTHYPSLAPAAPKSRRNAAEIMFWPSLIGN